MRNRNFLMTFVIGIAFLFLGLTIIFIFSRLMPGDPTAAYLPINASIEEREAIIRYLGLDKPIIIQYLRFLGDFLTGNWGLSSNISKGQPVGELIWERFPRTIEILILPLCIGGGLGYLISRISKREKHKWSKNAIQIISALFIAAPIFLIGMFSQYTLTYVLPNWIYNTFGLEVKIFPATGFKSPGYADPPFITGFRIIDSIISGQFYLTVDTLYHYALPIIILSVVITAVMTRFFSSNRVKDSYKKSTVLSQAAKTSAAFGVLLTFSILIETTFNLKGLGNLIINGIRRYDFFVITGVLGVIMLSLTITLLISNLAFSLYGLKNRELSSEVLKETTEIEPKLNGKKDTIVLDLKNYSKKLVRSPLTIIGVVAVLIPIILSIFAEPISGYSFYDATGFFAGAWNPPSPDHLLGTTDYGRDVLALSLYGTRAALLFGIGAAFVGLLGGLHLGLLAKLHPVVRIIVMSSTLIFYVLPGIIIVMLSIGIIGPLPGVITIAVGSLLIPSFTRIVANTELRIVPIVKKLLAYIPLFVGFSMFIYAPIGFLGYSSPQMVNLGQQIATGRYHLYDAPWATFWPGFVIFFITVSFFILHEGLAKHSR